MNTKYAASVETLFQATLADFVSERKRLAAELKAAGDKEGATRLSKLARPAVSAWAVNQLWWRERELFTELIGAAARVKAGARDANKAHRELSAELRQRAAAILTESGNAASESTLRRVATTLSAIAASGGFAPDEPGTLVADRDPPGFEVFAGTALVAGGTRASSETTDSKAEPDSETESAARRAEEEQVRRRAEAQEQARRNAERERLSTALAAAQERHGARQREIARLERELVLAQQKLEESQALLDDYTSKLAAL